MLSEESCHINSLFKRNSSIASLSVISLLIPGENSISEGKILENKKFHEIFNESKLLLVKLTRLHYLKHYMTLQMLSVFVFLGKQNLRNVWK